VFNKIVDSIEAELSAIALALEASFEYLIQLDHPNTVEQLFIFTDCKRAIDCIINRSQMNIYHCVLARVTASLMSLRSMKVCVSVAWIPGHSGIHYNEQADMAAKEALRLDTKLINGSIALPSCKRLLSKHIRKQWQTRWERSITARATFAHIPVVGRTYHSFSSDQMQCCQLCHTIDG